MAHSHCGACQHFDGNAQSLELQIPGLRSFGSGFAAVRTADGLCGLHQRYLSAQAQCTGFVRSAREAQSAVPVLSFWQRLRQRLRA